MTHTKKEEWIYCVALGAVLQARADGNHQREAHNLQTVAAIEGRHVAVCGDDCQYVVSAKARANFLLKIAALNQHAKALAIEKQARAVGQG